MADQSSTISPEIFKPIPGFPAYEVSDQGKVRSYWRQIRLPKGYGSRTILDSFPQRILKPILNDDGYHVVSLHEGGKMSRWLIHRLVLIAFIGPCPPGMEACHEDGNCTRNYLSNLRWDTDKANALDRIRHGNQRGTFGKGSKHPVAKLTEEKVLQIRELFARGCSAKKLCGLFDVHYQTIRRVVRRKIWTHI